MFKKGKRRRAAGWALRLGVVAAVAVAIVAIQGQASHAGEASAKISTQVLLDTANGQDASFVVLLNDQADLSDASSIADQDARGWYVYNALKEKAAATQGPILDLLDARGAPHRSFWIANMITSEGDRSLVEDLAERTDVKVIETNRSTDALDGEDEVESTDDGNAVEATEQGVTNTQSPSLWTLGFKGQGIVVANQDTGMRWTHAALRTHYRGWISGTTADNNYNWHDSIHARIDGSDGGTASPATNSCGYNLVAPCDDQGHGTHTTGTAIGDDAGAGVGTGTNQIGVAPGAKWIGCRNMDAGNGRAATYSECFQWFIAPTNLAGLNADPTKRPHVMNNSWGCPLVGELCARTVLQTVVNNTIASGIFVEVSAGNDGSACNTVQDPPSIYGNAFSTGAISGSTNALQSFSSRGPVNSDGSGRMKPDLVAPGASVRSSLRTNDTSYGTMSGTSMAGPHVVGVVALLWSARANLVRDIPRTEWLLTRSSNRTGITVPNNSGGCGGIVPTPNNHFGWGRVDALAAYNLEPSLNQSITFPAIAGKTYGDADFAPGASASSTLAVSYAASGNCSMVGGLVHISGAGSCTVTASQPGLDVYDIANTGPKPWYPAADVVRSFSIAKASQTISFGALGGKTYGDPDFGVAATSSSGLAVSFAATGNCTIAGATVHITGAGSCTVTASQGGNANYNAAPDVPQAFTIAKADQTIDFGALADKTYGEPDFDVAATSSSGLPVSFGAGGNCTVAGSTVHITGAGSCVIAASQGGDDNYNAAPDVTQPFSIAKAALTVKANNITKAFGTTYTFAGTEFTATGLFSPDSVASVTLTSAGAAAGAAGGFYPIVPSAAVGSGLGNYVVTYVNGSFRVVWPFTGLFQPVDNLPTLNVANAGSAIPVKFSLGGDRGLAIMAAGFPASTRIDCSSSAPQDTIEQTVTAGQSSLSFGSGQYVYVWKSLSAWAGTCRELEVKLVDGTDIKAKFKFK
jgi:serine protease AprX